MSLRFPVEGLDLWAREIPDGGLLVLEGSGATVARFVARQVAGAAARTGRAVLWASAFGDKVPHPPAGSGNGKDRPSLRTQKVRTWTDLQGRGATEALIVDSASWIGLSSTPAETAEHLLRLRHELAEHGTFGVLLLETGVLGEERDAILRHAADGLIQFRAREDPDGVSQFVRIPKWFGAGSITPNIYFTFDGESLLVDTRKRVV